VNYSFGGNNIAANSLDILTNKKLSLTFDEGEERGPVRFFFMLSQEMPAARILVDIVFSNFFPLGFLNGLHWKFVVDI
jgi:hypothetical protein